MPSDIFISYAREDRGRVQPIAEALAARGYGVWWDKGLRGGEDYRDRIEEMLKTAKCVIVAWSKESVQSDFVLDEAGRGHRRKVLLPVFIDEGVEPPLGFGGIHTSDLSGWLRDPSDPAPFEQFVGDVSAIIGREPAPAPPPRPASAPPAGGRKRGLLPVEIGGGALLVATAVMYLGADRAGVDVTSIEAGQDTAAPLVTDDPGAGPLAMDTARGGRAPTDSGSAPESAGASAAALQDLQCYVPTGGRNRLQDRRAAVMRMPYKVDTATHLLLTARGNPVPGEPAARLGTLRSRQVIVAHFTGLPEFAGERFLRTQDANASLHLIIGGDGGVRQMLPFDQGSLHAGAGQWQGLTRINQHSIGIGMDNLGSLRRREGAWYFGDSRRVPADSVLVVGGGGREQGWHRYTDAQLRAFFYVSCALRRAYPTIEQVVGHDSISPGRKTDPGPAFPISAMRASLFPAR